MGNVEYLSLPQYIAVKVSAERWQIAELIGEAGREGHRPPTYKAQPLKFTEGACNNQLTYLQSEARKSRQPIPADSGRSAAGLPGGLG